MNNKMPILIVSPPRSGSSLTASILNSFGVFGGDMKKGDKWNKSGYFENIEITNLVIRYLQNNDINNLGKRFNPRVLNVDVKDFSSKIYEILENQGMEPTQKWFYKNPKTAVCWRLFDKHYPYAKWIVIERDREELLNSLMRTEFMDAWQTKEEWQNFIRYYDVLMKEIKANCNCFVFNINTMFNGDYSQVEDLLKFVGIDAELVLSGIIDKTLWNEKK